MTAGRNAHRELTLLHVSDTQFGQYHRFDKPESLSGHLVRDVAGLRGLGVPPIDLVVLSGDIAERGLRSEYRQARAFLDELCGALDLPPSRIVLVPGNHDVNWSASEAYFAACKADEADPVAPYPQKWRHYKEFVTGLHGEASFTEEQPYRLHRFDELGVVVAAINSTMAETHQKDDHYGCCTTEQLRWFADQLAACDGLVRIGVLHHNVRRKAIADNENLKDETDLTEILGDSLDLLLHGHTHEGKEDRLSDGTLVLATGSAAITVDWRPGEVPNQYQVLRLAPGRITRWARQWAERKWIADTRASRDGNRISVDIAWPAAAWTAADRRDYERMADPAWVRIDVGRSLDFVEQVRSVTVADLGSEAVVERKVKFEPHLEYLLAFKPKSPGRCVGVVDGNLDHATLTAFDEKVFAPLRQHGTMEMVIVHLGPDEPALRTTAKGLGVFVKTWREYNDLLEPSAYRDWLTTRLDHDQNYPQRLYLPQRFRAIDRFGAAAATIERDLLDVVYDAMIEEDGRFVLVLGDAGFGKSFLVRKLARRMLDNDRINVSPVVVYLRERDKRESLDSMVSTALIPSGATFQAERFRHSLRAGTLALLVDGYDEFAVRVGYTNAAAQLRTFLDAMEGRARVLLTTRPSHFRTTTEVTTKLFDSLRVVRQAYVYQLEPFDETQQEAFLARWFTLADEQEPAANAHQWMRALASVDNLPELARTPRMLSYIVQDLTLDEINEAASTGAVLTAAALYQRLVSRWLAGEPLHPDSKGTISAAERQRVMEELALALWRGGEIDADEDALHAAVRVVLDLPRLELTLDQAAQEVGGRALLQVTSGRWKFAHQSVWEFLLANRLAALLRAGAADGVLGEAELTGLTVRFLRDLAPGEAGAWLRRLSAGAA